MISPVETSIVGPAPEMGAFLTRLFSWSVQKTSVAWRAMPWRLPGIVLGPSAIGVGMGAPPIGIVSTNLAPVLNQ